MKRVFKFLSQTFKFLLLLKNKRKISDLINLRDRHKGEECYIFGDGVSLKYFDLSVFNDRIAIGSNNLIFHKDFKKLNIKYYCIYEPFWFLPYFVSGFKGVKIWKNKIQKYHQLIAKENKQITFFTDISNSIRFIGSNIIYVSTQIVNNITDENFISHKINCFEGSLRVQLMIAKFLGFNKVYLIGHDYLNSETISGHFYEKGPGVKTKNTHDSWNNDFLKLMKKKLEIISITNNNTSLKVKTIPYEKFKGDTLNYKENNEIVSLKNLQILSSWPKYFI